MAKRKKPVLREVLAFETKLAGFPIELRQVGSGRHSFSVRYGMQHRKNLTYTQAAEDLGHCLMHALCCEGKLEVEDE